MLKKIIDKIRIVKDYFFLPLSAKTECLRDLFYSIGPDPGIEHAVEESIAWLCRAQDCSINS